MDAARFDGVTRALGQVVPRRAALGLAALAAVAPAAARGKKRCKTSRCPVYEVCAGKRCRCEGERSKKPYTCGPNRGGIA
jgi:hypothetical protein